MLGKLFKAKHDIFVLVIKYEPKQERITIITPSGKTASWSQKYLKYFWEEVK